MTSQKGVLEGPVSRASVAGALPISPGRPPLSQSLAAGSPAVAWAAPAPSMSYGTTHRNQGSAWTREAVAPP
jgi:hypothetical protein